MPFITQYLEVDEVAEIFNDHNLDDLPDDRKDRAVRQANGLLESELNKRFIIPLKGKGALGYTDAPEFTRMKVEMAFRNAFLYVLGSKYMKNSDLSDLGEFTSDQLKQFTRHTKDLLDFNSDYNLELKPYAQDAVEPVQSIGIARANNDTTYD